MILPTKRLIYTAARQSSPDPNQARVLAGVGSESYKSRHIGPRPRDVAFMLSRIGFPSLDSMMKALLPKELSNVAVEALGIKLPEPISESKMLSIASHYASMNRISKSYIGDGYHDVKTPSIIKRAVLESPAWYSPYTPYQAEISQGRLQALFTFQTMVSELAGLPIANASLLDEATAAAEAMMMLYNSNEGKKQKFLVDRNVYPQTIKVLWSRGEPLGINLKLVDLQSDLAPDEAFGLLVQYPNRFGSLSDSVELIESARRMGIKIVTAADPLALAILKSPGELGADVSIGTTQRFGIPMGYGGPHAAYIAAKKEYKRLMPGRMVGETHDAQGNRGYRLALQTREQHIRRDKATSNICTAQALLANMAAFYAIYLGPNGLRDAAMHVHGQTRLLGEACIKYGHRLVSESFFDTISFVPGNGMKAQDLHQIADSYGVLLGSPASNVVSISTHQDCDEDAIFTLLKILQGMPAGTTHSVESTAILSGSLDKPSPTTEYFRKDQFLKQNVFNSYHSETELLRFIYTLQKKDMTLADSMIPLGSCSMKSNGVSILSPLSWPGLNGIHPFSPPAYSAGFQRIIEDLEEYLCQITGFWAFSFQPNSGAQGEFAGLKVIQAYHQNDPSTTERDVCLVPVSAHGTNPASAAMTGFKVVPLGCNNDGSISMESLERSLASFGPRIACIMLTYPSTYGVFDSNVLKITEMVHSVGGLVYLDGANMNAMLGHLRPADLGADVGHLNLHKTFCIPHGGGGPGVGPIGVTSKLAPFLPSHHTLPPTSAPDLRILPVSAAPFGSASLLVIPWAYVRLMGLAGLKECTEVAVLNANYVMRGLEKEYKILNSGGLCGHEFIIDCRPFQESAGVTVGDIAKRLQDYSIHSPTVSWPVPGALTVEPTESEGLQELDRFIEAMLSVRSEIGKVENGQYPRDNNPLKNAPHPQSVVMASEWRYPYSREEAAFPVSGLCDRKSWPTLGRLDEAFGDQNFCCTLS